MKRWIHLFAATLFGLLFQFSMAAHSYAQAAPTISGFSDTSGINGTPITIYGTNFSTTGSNNSVNFYKTYNGTCQCAVASVVAATSTALTVRVPNFAVTGPIKVTVNGQSVTSSSIFTVDDSLPVACGSAAPENATISSAATTQRFYVYGVHNAIGVYLDTWWTHYPQGSGGSYQLSEGTYMGNNTWYADIDLSPFTFAGIPLFGNFTTLVSVNGYSSSQISCGAASYSWTRAMPPPTITNFSPSVGAAGDVVALNGTHFDPNLNNNSVTFNGIAATNFYVGTEQLVGNGATLLSVIVPSGATSGPVRVTVDGQSFTASAPFYAVNSITATPSVISNFSATAVTAQIGTAVANIPVSVSCYSNLADVNVNVLPISNVVNTNSQGKAVFTLTSPTLAGFNPDTTASADVGCIFYAGSVSSNPVTFTVTNICKLPLSPLPAPCGNPSP